MDEYFCHNVKNNAKSDRQLKLLLLVIILNVKLPIEIFTLKPLWCSSRHFCLKVSLHINLCEALAINLSLEANMKSYTNVEIENNYFVNVHVYVFMNERRRRTKVGYALLIKLCSFIFHWSHLVLSLKGTFYSMNIIKWFNLLCFYLKEEQCKWSLGMLWSCKVYQGNHFCKSAK